jgi:hypothetical protein
MQSLIDYLGCGRLCRKRDVYEFQVSKFSDTLPGIFTFFAKYPVLGMKAKDLEDFSFVAGLMRNKAHLTEQGLAKIKKIKEGMNKGRKF